MLNTKLYRKDLNLGCGGEYYDGWLGVDIVKDSFARLYHDLNRPYLPFKDKCVSFVVIKRTIAYINHPEKLIEECKRVAVDGIGIIPCYCETCKSILSDREITKSILFDQFPINSNYNKPQIIFLTQDKDKRKECIAKFGHWTNNLPPISKAVSKKYFKKLLRDIETDEAYSRQCREYEFDLSMFIGW